MAFMILVKQALAVGHCTPLQNGHTELGSVFARAAPLLPQHRSALRLRAKAEIARLEVGLRAVPDAALRILGARNRVAFRR